MRPHFTCHVPWHGFVHRSPTFLFGVVLLALGWFDFVGQDAISAFLQLVMGENAAAKVMIVVGLVVPTIRFLTVTPLLAGLRSWLAPPAADPSPEEPPHD